MIDREKKEENATTKKALGFRIKYIPVIDFLKQERKYAPLKVLTELRTTTATKIIIILKQVQNQYLLRRTVLIRVELGQFLFVLFFVVIVVVVVVFKRSNLCHTIRGAFVLL